jgi:chromate transporter
MGLQISLSAADWLNLFVHFLSLSLMAIGGAITTAPDMHRYLVTEQHWLSVGQFSSSIAIAQAAPGPNVLFVALLGWNVGMNAAGALSVPGLAPVGYGLLGVSLAMLGIMLPSTTLTFVAARWGHRNKDLRAVRAFKQGMAPVVVALLTATGWILTASHGELSAHWPLWLATAASAIIVWRTRLHLLWLLGAGGVMGWLGWI